MSNRKGAVLTASLGLNKADRKVVAACAGWAVISAAGFGLYGALYTLRFARIGFRSS